MDIESSRLANDVRLIQLSGRMDMKGVESIDLQFNSFVASEKGGVVVDFSQVDFLSSAGIRLLLTNARGLQLRGGKMALLNPTPLVAEVLQTSGVAAWIPIFADLDAACRAVLAGLHD